MVQFGGSTEQSDSGVVPIRAWWALFILLTSRFPSYFRILVLVMYDSGQVSLEHLRFQSSDIGMQVSGFELRGSTDEGLVSIIHPPDVVLSRERVGDSTEEGKMSISG